MEINPQHPIIQALREEPDEQRFNNWAFILFEQALLSEGGHLDDPGEFVKRINEMFITMGNFNSPRIITLN